MQPYYLTHAIIYPKPEKILKILKDGYLLAGKYSNETGVYHDTPLEYIYFSLLGSLPPFHPGVTFILDTKLLNRRSFRYALSWLGDEIDKTTKINPRYQNIGKILDFINQHIENINLIDPKMTQFSHEILLKKKVNLHKYLVAICCRDSLSNESIEYIHKYYPSVKILDNFPESACGFKVRA